MQVKFCILPVNPKFRSQARVFQKLLTEYQPFNTLFKTIYIYCVLNTVQKVNLQIIFQNREQLLGSLGSLVKYKISLAGQNPDSKQLKPNFARKLATITTHLTYTLTHIPLLLMTTIIAFDNNYLFTITKHNKLLPIKSEI